MAFFQSAGPVRGYPKSNGRTPRLQDPLSSDKSSRNADASYVLNSFDHQKMKSLENNIEGIVTGRVVCMKLCNLVQAELDPHSNDLNGSKVQNPIPFNPSTNFVRSNVELIGSIKNYH